MAWASRCGRSRPLRAARSAASPRALPSAGPSSRSARSRPATAPPAGPPTRSSGALAEGSSGRAEADLGQRGPAEQAVRIRQRLQDLEVVGALGDEQRRGLVGCLEQREEVGGLALELRRL